MKKEYLFDGDEIMFRLLKQAFYELVNECAEEMKEMQHIENVARLYKEDE